MDWSEPTDETAQAETPPEGRAGRLREIAYAELAGFHPRLRLLNALLFCLPYLCFARIRTALYRLAGVRIGRGTVIMGRIELAGPGPVWRRFETGEDCIITTPLYVDLSAEVTFGQAVTVGHHVVFVTADHDMTYPERRCGAKVPRPIVVEDGAWIGARATILPGVTIGRGSVVAAGAVVARDVPPNTLVGGVPAKAIKILAGG